MIKWTKVDPVTGQSVKRGEGRSFMPHNYRADGEHPGALILNARHAQGQRDCPV